jgi:hypothetical protein
LKICNFCVGLILTKNQTGSSHLFFYFQLWMGQVRFFNSGIHKLILNFLYLGGIINANVDGKSCCYVLKTPTR